MTDAGLYGETIGVGLAKCLLDVNPYVRLETINWAVYTTDDRFDDFSRRVTGDVLSEGLRFSEDPELKRGSGGLCVVRRLREGESIETIRQSTPGEDGFTFDYLQLFEKRLKRYVERRKSKVWTDTADVSACYDEFEIGVAGEVYDNLGMLKGDLPLSVPAHVTNAQFDDMMDRATESMRQRKLDQNSLDQSKEK